MKAIIIGFAVLFLVAMCQPSSATPHGTLIRLQRAPKEDKVDPYRLQIKKNEGEPFSLRAEVNRQVYDDGKHKVDLSARVGSPDMSHYNPGGSVNYEYKQTDNLSWKLNTNVQKTHGGGLDTQVHGGLSYNW